MANAVHTLHSSSTGCRKYETAIAIVTFPMGNTRCASCYSILSLEGLVVHNEAIKFSLNIRRQAYYANRPLLGAPGIFIYIG
ncbi:hypothetical protein BC936DRAFT_142740 [Jimgerdemannia flammicorona]|uniref:Uncharacterized protein n=1 Tax=Jimgerdemannia flammicorona TaxID=994334 RepID=A0A433DEW7_9FUNG|nr:hypothetical protein BC936DRAFT_142740 [Jimgerdemannia flammicorona]